MPNRRPKGIFSDQNYALFAVLANVRNPVRAVKPFKYISQPKGLPPDVSEPVRQWHAAFEGDAFGESWLALIELTNFDSMGKP
jgi:hypothetical protein